MFPHYALYLPLVAALGLLPLTNYAESVASNQGSTSTPPMGWNSWNHFGCNVSESTISDAMDYVVSVQLQDYGYEYIIIDDCWHANARDNITRQPVADPVHFPRGIKYLADRAHNMGLKFGIYSSAGVRTCGGRFGSLGYEEIDAKTYAEWGVDYLKYDNCNNNGLHGSKEISLERFGNMSRALESTGRPIIYAMCNWGEDASWEWASEIADTWRIYGDIITRYDGYDSRCPCGPSDRYNCTNLGHHCSVARVLEWAAPLSQYGGREQGGWNDLDMLEVGNGNMTYDEYVTHFSLWAILKSPLILGSNLPNMTPDELSIVTNREIIRINKDPLGVSARLRWKRDLKTGGDLQLWAGPLENNGHVVALLNNSPGPLNITFTLGDILAASPLQKGPEMVWQMLDLWSPREPASHKGPSVFLRSSEDISVALRSHQTQVWRVKPVSPLQLGSTS